MERRQKQNTLMMAGLMVMLSFTQVGCNPADVLKGIAAGLNAVASGMSSSSSSTTTGTGTTAATGTAASPATSTLSSLVSKLNSSASTAKPVSTAGELPRLDSSVSK